MNHFDKARSSRSHDLVVFVVAVDDNRLLMVRLYLTSSVVFVCVERLHVVFVQVQEPARKKYQFFLPAGHIDAKETVADACARECKEESGLHVDCVGLYDLIYGSNSYAPLHFVVGGHVTGGQLKDPSQEDDESRCACWFPLPDVMRELTPEAAQHGLGLDTSTAGPRYQGYRQPHEIGGVLRRFIKARASKSGPVPLLFVPPSGS